MKHTVKITRSIEQVTEIDVEFPFYRLLDRCDDYPAPKRQTWIAVMSPTLQWHVAEVYTDHVGDELAQVELSRFDDAKVSAAMLSADHSTMYTMTGREAFRDAIDQYEAFKARFFDEVGHNDTANIR